MVAVIEFRVETVNTPSGAPLQVMVPWIDGVSLVEIAERAGYSGRIGVGDRPVSWPRPYYMRGARVVVLNDPSGDEDADITVRVTDDGEGFLWADWRTGAGYRTTVALPEFLFDYNQYVTALKATEGFENDWTLDQLWR